jgi:hypothetical protein
MKHPDVSACIVKCYTSSVRFPRTTLKNNIRRFQRIFQRAAHHGQIRGPNRVIPRLYRARLENELKQ